MAMGIDSHIYNLADVKIYEINKNRKITNSKRKNYLKE